MFICDMCKKQTKPNTRANRVVVETKQKIYDSKMVNGSRKIAMGKEIAKEAMICDVCFQRKNY